MLVIIGRMFGKILFSSVVGVGSSLHDLDLVFIISFDTWSSFCFLKLLNSGTSDMDGW